MTIKSTPTSPANRKISSWAVPWPTICYTVTSFGTLAAARS